MCARARVRVVHMYTYQGAELLPVKGETVNFCSYRWCVCVCVCVLDWNDTGLILVAFHTEGLAGACLAVGKDAHVVTVEHACHQCFHLSEHLHTHTRTHAHTHARTHARKHTHTHILIHSHSLSLSLSLILFKHLLLRGLRAKAVVEFKRLFAAFALV